MENDNRNDGRIGLNDLFSVLKRSFLFMICAALVCGVVAGFCTEFFVQKQYAVTLKFKVMAVDSSGSAGQNLSVASVPDVLELIHNGTDLAKQVLKSMTTTNEKGEDVKVADSPENIAILQNSISSSYSANSSVFTVTFTNADPDVAFNMAVAMADVAPVYFSESDMVSFGSNGAEKGGLKLVRGAEMSDYSTPVYPNVFLASALAACLGALICYGVFFLIHVMDTTIRTEEDLKNVSDYPILGMIPSIHPEEMVPETAGEVQENV